MLFRKRKHSFNAFIAMSILLGTIILITFFMVISGDFYSHSQAPLAFVWYVLVAGWLGRVLWYACEEDEFCDRRYEKRLTFMFVILIVVSGTKFFPLDQTFTCKDQQVVRMELSEDLRTSEFDDGKYFQVTCKGEEPFYVDDDYQLNPENEYLDAMKYRTDNPSEREASNYEAIINN